MMVTTSAASPWPLAWPEQQDPPEVLWKCLTTEILGTGGDDGFHGGREPRTRPWVGRLKRCLEIPERD